MPNLDFWKSFYNQSVQAVLPKNCLPPYLEQFKDKTVKVVAVGKAAADMAVVAEQCLGDVIAGGVAIAPHGTRSKLNKIKLLTASHPVPDEASIKAAQTVTQCVKNCGPAEQLLVLLSGGGSALMCAPISGVSLGFKQQVTAALLGAGVAIQDINFVRAHLSQLKGGGLLEYLQPGVQCHTFAVSDVVNDDPATIASGPTVPTNIDTARVNILLERCGLSLPNGAKPLERKPRPAPPYTVIANSSLALNAAESWLVGQGYEIHQLGNAVEGEAREQALVHTETVVDVVAKEPHTATAFLSGGELTVTVRGEGMGGPNQEYLQYVLHGLPVGPFAGFAADTDGVDGIGGAAGAYFSSTMLKQAKSLKLQSQFDDRSNSYSFFNKLSGNFNVKPTGTNVNDLRVILYNPDFKSS